MAMGQVMEAARDILRGLIELHGAGISMMDLRPDTVCLTKQQTAVLMGFSIRGLVAEAFGSRDPFRNLSPYTMQWR